MFINIIRPRFYMEFSEQCEFILIIIQNIINVHIIVNLFRMHYI